MSIPRKSSATQTEAMPLIYNAARQDPEQSEIVNISHTHGFPLQRCIGANGHEYYAVQDWLTGVAQTENARKLWSDTKRLKNELYDSIVQLPYLASNGRTYQMDYADGRSIYQITQHLRANTGIRDEVLTHLANTGAFVDAARQDPERAEIAIHQFAQHKSESSGKDAAWIAVRDMGKVTRKQFASALLRANPKVHLGIATNGVYEGVFRKTSDGLNATLGLKPKSNPRDHMSRLALAYTMVAEEAIQLHLEDYAESDIVPLKVMYATIKTISEGVGIQADTMARTLHIDLVTGRKLLNS